MRILEFHRTIVKLKKLVGALEGEALAAVRPYSVHVDNYQVIKQVLRNRFGKPKKIFTDMFRKIQHHPQVNNKDLAGFRSYVDLCLEMVHHLELHRSETMLDPEPYALAIESKLPQECLVRWEKKKEDYLFHTDGEIPPKKLLGELVEFLDDHVERIRLSHHRNPHLAKTYREAREHEKPKKSRDSQSKGAKDKSSKAKKGGSGASGASGEKKAVSYQPKATVDNFTTVTEVNDKEKAKRKEKGRDPKKCCFCKSDGHAPRNCVGDLPDPDTALRLVMEAELCISCLREGHRLRECGNLKTCPKDGCTQKHHPMLHGCKSLKSTRQTDRKPKRKSA